MLTKEENDYLCRVGPGTPMGNLLRRYWLPVALSSEVPEAHCPPVRVRVLGEDLIAFRDTNGQVGLLAANCPHRGASLFFGRNEELGLRCVYHGWKFDVTGQCVDMPSEPAESNFKSKIRAAAYPVHESGGALWAYMGPAETLTPFRDFGSDSVPREQWNASKILSTCNYVQAMEGNIDSSHVSFLHRAALLQRPDDGTDRPGHPSTETSHWIRSHIGDPVVEVEDTEYGFRYAGIRTTPNGHRHVRMTVFAMPVMTFVAPIVRGLRGCGMFVPMDDHHVWRFQVSMEGTTLEQRQAMARASQSFGPQGGSVFVDSQGNRLRTAENDYLIDRDAQRTGKSYTGILGVGNQDYAVTESMGAIFDRSTEHLGTTDLAIIRMRQQLITAARNLERGIEPPALRPDYPYDEIYPEERIIAAGEDWRYLATEEDPLRDLILTGAQ